MSRLYDIGGEHPRDGKDVGFAEVVGHIDFDRASLLGEYHWPGDAGTVHRTCSWGAPHRRALLEGPGVVAYSGDCLVFACPFCYLGGAMLCDFHTHTMLSDGSLSPMELIHRALKRGYRAVAITDHMGLGTLESYLPAVAKECKLAERHWDIVAIPGVELTHVPPAALGEVARTAKAMGATLVLVHGETVVEPVPPGTNLAALSSPHVDVLAHPGLLSPEEARLAAANGIFLEISARKGHCLGNGRVARMARAAGARLLVNSDTHDPEDLLTAEFRLSVAMGAGLERHEIDELPASVLTLLEKLGIAPKRYRAAGV